MNSLNETLLNLIWDDLRQWAGSKIAGRGKAYIKNVSGLARTESGGLIAWVSGSEDYATNVEVDDDGELDWFCTCPYYDGPCKHAVAVILAGLAQEKAGREIPLVDKEDDLYLALLDDSGEDEDFPDEDDFAGQESGAAQVVAPVKSGGGKNPALAGILREKSKEELIELLLDFAAHHPEVKRKIEEDNQLRSGKIDKLASALRKEIQAVTREPAWYNPWKNEGNRPDYSHIKEQLGALLRGGHADIVVELGRELWERGNEQVEQSHDEGEAACEIGECLEIVFQAVQASSLSRPDQLLWMIDIFLEDQFSISDSCERFIQNKAYGVEEWAEVAANLQKRLDTRTVSRQDGFSGIYHRERVMHRLIDAFKRSGQQNKIIPLLEREAHATQCYGRLADAFLQNGEHEKAREWCIKGFQKTQTSAPGIASGLQKKLRELARLEMKFDLAAAYLAQDFFDHPTPIKYRELQQAAEKVQCWPAVRAAALAFLESGLRPDLPGEGGNRQPWPLPCPEVAAKPDKMSSRGRDYPDLNALIDIAILEKRGDDVVKLYQEQQKKLRWGFGKGEEVAQAVAGSHPDISLAIWKKLAEGQINLVKPKAYEEAAVYLRKMSNIYQKTKRLEHWRALLRSLRTEHKAKRRLLEVLDSLENKKIIG